jgi:V8-like Glu-specific endopeptidase
MSDINIKKEVLIQDQPIPVPIEGIKKILFQLENCICQIYNKNGGKGTGFFTKILFKNKLLPVLITNNHVLEEKDIKDNEIIELTMYDKKENGNKDISIKIDNLRIRYTNSEIDITIIEIKPEEDKINSNYLEIEEEEMTEKEYRKRSIYILHYPNKKYVSYGLINELREYKTIIHYCNTEDGSSGSPILSLETYKVMGVHYGGKKKHNYGTYIKYAINEINKKYEKKYKNEINIKYITKKEDYENIFGEEFVENNKNNIELEINGEKSKLIERYKLVNGINNIKIIIKNKLINLKDMFKWCDALKDINELKY